MNGTIKTTGDLGPGIKFASYQKEASHMTNKMELAKNTLLMQAIQNFDNDYLERLFGGVINLDTFGDMLLVEFIKRAYCDEALPHSLRHFVPYGADDNSPRMMYSRIIGYVQKYRNREYEELSKLEGIDLSTLEPLRPQRMDTIKQRLQGHNFTELQFLELTTIHDLQIVKALVSKRIVSVKKISNSQFQEYIKEYENWVSDLRKKQSGSDADVVFSALAFFTFEWKFSIELVYQVARQMEIINAKKIDKATLSLLCGRLIFDCSITKNVGCDSRAAKERQLLIPDFIKEPTDLDKRNVNERSRYLEILGLLLVIKNHLPINNQTPDVWFAQNTSLEDWASFFREYNIFECWHSKELTKATIRNMRTVFDMKTS